MKLFVNSANVEIVRRLVGIGIMDGVTTNPSVMAAEGKDFREVYTPTQALLAAKLGGKYIASFVKRQDSIASSGVEVLQKVIKIL